MFTEREKAVIKSMAKNDLKAYAVAKELHYHRNTIIYRLKQIHKKYGIDPQTFYGLSELITMVESEETIGGLRSALRNKNC